MGARGPHDDFESAKRVIRAAYAQFALDQDLDAAAAYIDEDAEYVTRDGTFRGSDRWRSELSAQMEGWRVEIEIEEIVEAGEGAVVLLNKVRRIDKETGRAVFKAWPANVVRVHDGRFVFFEGYVDRRKALADLGVEQA
jgi:ketosteroid isomerase-like protein